MVTNAARKFTLAWEKDRWVCRDRDGVVFAHPDYTESERRVDWLEAGQIDAPWSEEDDEVLWCYELMFALFVGTLVLAAILLL